MLIREIDPRDDAELHEVYVVIRAAFLEGNPERPIWPEDLMRANLQDPGEETQLQLWGAFDGDASERRLLGCGLLFLRQRDNLTMGFAGVSVHPDHQRQGIGGQLIENAVERARAAGRRVVLADSTYAFDQRESHGYRRFAERHGFALASSEVTRRLELPIPAEQLQGWLDEAAPWHRDYRIETFDEVPPELVPSMCDVVNQLALDAPTGDLDFEASQETPADYEHGRDRDRAIGASVVKTLPLNANGTVVAVTTIYASTSEPLLGRQGATIVRRADRGHRLGLAIKAANLRAFQRDYPGRRSIVTQNNEDNANMVDINARMGFAPLELNVAFQRTID